MPRIPHSLLCGLRGRTKQNENEYLKGVAIYISNY